MEIRSKQKANKGEVIVLDDNKKYLVLDCRSLIKYLGEPEGYLITLEKLDE